jgi:excisionase family DNA binding protein
MKKSVPDVMTLIEVAEYLRIPRSTAYKLAQEGKIRGQKIGRYCGSTRLPSTSG